MRLPASSELRDLATDSVRRALATGAEAAEAFVNAASGAEVKVEGSRITQASSGEEFGVGLRVVRGRRVGFAYCSRPEDVADAARRALDAAQILGDSPLSFPGPAPTPAVEGLVDPRIPGLGVEDALESCELMLESALSQHADLVASGGGLGWGEEAFALANSAGFADASRGTEAGASLFAVLRNGDVSTGFEFAHGRAFDFDPVAVGYGAAALAVASRGAKRPPSALTTVVFRPSALDGLVEGILARGLLGDVAEAGQSWYSGRVGERVLPEEYDFVDDGRVRGGPRSAPFDDEGVPTRRQALVERGVLRGYLHDLASAERYGTSASGSAIRADRLDDSRSFRAAPRASGRNFAFDGPREDDLLEGIREGLVVHDALGAHTANPTSGDFSVNATVVFRVKNGAIVGAATPVMLSGNLPALLRDLDGLGTDDRWVGGDMTASALQLPSVRLRNLRVTA